MRRRDFIHLAAGAAVARPLSAGAQLSRSSLRVGMLGFAPRSAPILGVLVRRLAEYGHRESENFTFDYVQVAATPEAMNNGFREVVARNPDILIAIGPEACLRAAVAATTTTPIVMMAVDYDPIARGYVSSLAGPGGRITGVFQQQIELTVKRLQFFKESIPDFSAALVIYDEASREQWEAAKNAAVKFGLRLSGTGFHDQPYDYDHAFVDAPPDNRKNLFVLMSPVFFNDRERLATFALRSRLSSMFGLRYWVDAGGLMSYGVNEAEVFTAAADSVGRIARGAKPGDLPIVQPTKFEFVVNLATARALGVELSPVLLARADEVIE